jgi:hypothetical protein
VRFEVLIAVKMSFWIVMLYRLVGTYQRFGEVYTLYVFIPEDGNSKFLQNFDFYLPVCGVMTQNSIDIKVCSLNCEILEGEFSPTLVNTRGNGTVSLIKITYF